MFSFGIKDIIDILIVALLLYTLYKMMKESGTISIFTGVLAFVGVWIVVKQILDMRLIGSIMDKFMSVGLLILVILFQDEIKRFLVQLGSHKRWRFFFNFFLKHKDQGEKPYIIPVVYACMNMAKTKTGALIVIEQGVSLDNYKNTGDTINANVNARLIENIFFKNSPLHDGAMIVRAGRVCAAGCVLPLSGNQSLSRDLGTRHRAAVGMSESADSVLVVVSEETGSISVAIGGMLKRHLSPDMLRKLLENELLDSEKQEKSRLAAIRDMWKGGAGK